MPETYILGLSTGRTGTKYLADLFSRFPSSSGSIISEHESRYSRTLNVAGNLYRSSLLNETCLRLIWDGLKKNEVDSKRADTYLDFNNHLYAIANLIKEKHASLKILHIVRDPRTYVRSHINWARHRWKSYVAKNIVPFWQPNGALIGPYAWRSWWQASDIEKYAWIWSYKNNVIESYRDLGIPYLMIRFEDLFSAENGMQALSKIAEFSNLVLPNDIEKLATRLVNETRVRTMPDWSQWPASDVAALARVCGKQMECYGYELGPNRPQGVISSG